MTARHGNPRFSGRHPAYHTGRSTYGRSKLREIDGGLKGRSDMVRMLRRFLRGDNRVRIVGHWGL